MVAGRCIVAAAWETKALKHRIKGSIRAFRPRALPPHATQNRAARQPSNDAQGHCQLPRPHPRPPAMSLFSRVFLTAAEAYCHL